MKIDWNLVLSIVIAGIIVYALTELVVEPLVEKAKESFEFN